MVTVGDDDGLGLFMCFLMYICLGVRLTLCMYVCMYLGVDVGVGVGVGGGMYRWLVYGYSAPSAMDLVAFFG